MPWSRWHWLIVISLGVTWIFDGLEVTLAGSLGGILTRRETLGLTDTEVGANATFYLAGAALGSGATLFLLDPNRFPIELGWRFAFGIGATLGLVIIFFRRWIPESPRWLMIHGRNAEAEKIVDQVERRIVADPGTLPAHD